MVMRHHDIFGVKSFQIHGMRTATIPLNHGNDLLSRPDLLSSFPLDHETEHVDDLHRVHRNTYDTLYLINCNKCRICFYLYTIK